jgi:hypothetical protein
MADELVDGELLYSDEDTGPYRVRLWFGNANGQWGIVGVEMWGVEPGVGRPWFDRSIRGLAKGPQDNPASFEEVPALPEALIGAKDIRLPLGALRDRWVEAHKAIERAGTAMGADTHGVQDYLASINEPKKRGREPLQPELLKTVAKHYRDAVTARDRAPAKAVLRKLNELGVKGDKGAALNASTVRSWIAAAKVRYPEQKETN